MILDIRTTKVAFIQEDHFNSAKLTLDADLDPLLNPRICRVEREDPPVFDTKVTSRAYLLVGSREDIELLLNGIRDPTEGGYRWDLLPVALPF